MNTYQYNGFTLVVTKQGVTVYNNNKVMYDTTSLDLAMKWVNSNQASKNK